jgi:hypothetical protein
MPPQSPADPLINSLYGMASGGNILDALKQGGHNLMQMFGLGDVHAPVITDRDRMIEQMNQKLNDDAVKRAQDSFKKPQVKPDVWAK